ncbi:tyrosine-protein phosphatase [Denitratisoma sp. DHT3]|uniref:tyrosine-protein phosphatase n=1 Tax=Denitratisoma sp. DHT3 TaxID=1981880 RepID=UPI0016473022|nr:tyrosine-protein phosphatase [Denitratisoma sp. DHT3]
MSKLLNTIICLFLALLTVGRSLAETPPPPEPPRQIVLEGARNFRDLGGYPAGNGYRVAYGRIFRSDNLSHLSVQDWQTLRKLGIGTVVDFRSAEEVQATPPQAPAGIRVKALPIGFAGMNIEDFRKRLMSGDLDRELQIQTYSNIALKQSESYRQWFALLQQAPVGSVFHCTSGKDRTGLAAVLLLTTLGVPREIALEDFVASNTFLKEGIEVTLRNIRKNPSFKGNEQDIRRLLGVERRQMEQTIADIEARYGSLDRYLEDVLGVGEKERKTLQSLYLEAIPSD